ncbi:MAG: ribonucleotide reductase subunit alpha [Adlercreutzia sp.]|nr:ribonucleotide reductase subunit alpha [Adlercreutzia sp.]
MRENMDANMPPCDDGAAAASDYLARAVAACEAGDARLGLHLYLAAFEEAVEGADTPSEDAIFGLKQAWRVACSAKERALAEYIFERLEPYLSNDEAAACAEQLQGLALDRLEEFGVSRNDIEEMSAALSQDMMAMGPPLALMPPLPTPPAAEDAPEVHPIDIITYDTVAGYGTVIERMRALGVGMAGNPEFDDFVSLLNARHGLDAMPVIDSLLFCSPAREDAGRFMLATVGELGLPAVRMRMEETFQGASVLCVSAQAEDAEKLGALRRGFEGGGVLVLEDVDLWGSPVAEMTDDVSSFLMASMSRGAREAVNLIRQAVENPEVYVLASATSIDAVDPFFLDLLNPVSCIDIELPTVEERVDVWMDIARSHPSLRSLNRDELVRLTAHMPRYDIYMAAREAVEEAYKQGLVARRYQPVTRQNLFDKLAAYQPLDSAEYVELERVVVTDFSAGLDNLEDLLS